MSQVEKDVVEKLAEISESPGMDFGVEHIALPVDVLQGILRAATRNDEIAREVDALTEAVKVGASLVAAAVIQNGKELVSFQDYVDEEPRDLAVDSCNVLEDLRELIVEPLGQLRRLRERELAARITSRTTWTDRGSPPKSEAQVQILVDGEPYRHVSIFPLDSFLGGAPYGVNWSALGIKDGEEAELFAAVLRYANEVVRMLNFQSGQVPTGKEGAE